MGRTLKKDDTAVVLSGRDAGKRGRVIAVLRKKDRVIIESINVVKKHMKPSKQYQQGGIIEKEASIHLSNAMLVCPKCDSPTRIKNRILETGARHRACGKCKEVID